jgi:hypothetical protein
MEHFIPEITAYGNVMIADDHFVAIDAVNLGGG